MSLTGKRFETEDFISVKVTLSLTVNFVLGSPLAAR